MKLNNLRPAHIFFPLIWAMFVIKSLVYIAVTPLWEGFDELFHFAYIQSLAATRSLPVWGETFIDADIAKSTAYVPLAGLMPQLAHGFEKLSYRDYWQVDEAERERFRKQLYQLKASSDRLTASSALLYQVQHPPLYYALCIPLYKAIDGRNIVDKVYALRVFSALLASVCVVAAALKAGERDSPLSPLLVGLVALWPCLYVDIARVGNDSLGIAIFSLISLAMIRYGAKRSVGRAVALGVLLGLGLLTKAYFLTAIPGIALFTTVLAFKYKDERKQILFDGCVTLLCAGAVGGWWYLRNYHLYGSFSGLQETMYFPSVGLSDRIRAIPEVSWVLVFKHLFTTFCWVSGWSFLHLPKPLYLVFAALFVIATVGLAKTILSKGKQKEELTKRTNAVVAAACLVIFFAVGVAYHEVNAFATVRVMGGPGGWYFYAIVVPISLLVSLGIWGTKPKFAHRSFAVIFAATVMLEVYGFSFVLAPYYTGIAVPAADGWGVSFVETAIALFSRETLSRLLTNKPALLSSSSLASIAVLYCLAQIAVLLSIALGAASSSSPPETTSHPD
ncbi:MAG: glycosyltransferase family 39 protein [Candidatus Hydrogenedentota bacterium]|nr:MAG: glycosyltransferase family 39 protein [Candidatus Hydrogenedentota bacterium]